MSNLFVLVAHWHGYTHANPIGVYPTLEAAKDYALEYDGEWSDDGEEIESLVWTDENNAQEPGGVSEKMGHDDPADFYGEGGNYANYSIFAFTEPWIEALLALRPTPVEGRGARSTGRVRIET